MTDQYWAARASSTWKRRRDEFLPRMQGGEVKVRATLYQPLSTASVHLAVPVPHQEAFESVIFEYEVCQPDDGSDAYWAVTAENPDRKSWSSLMETARILAGRR